MKPATRDARPAGAPRRGSWPRWTALAGLLVASVVIFWIVMRAAGGVDAPADPQMAPYLAMAQRVAAGEGARAGFNYVGNASRLPCFPNFIAPGLGALLGLIAPLTGGGLGQAGALLAWLSLLLSVLFADRFIRRHTGDRRYAFACALLVVAHPQVAGWATGVSIEVPFAACLLGVLLAADEVVRATRAGAASDRPPAAPEAPRGDDAAAALQAALAAAGEAEWERFERRWHLRWAWLALTVGSILLVLLRHLGGVVPPVVAALYLGAVWRRGAGRGTGRRTPRALRPLLLYGIAVYTPLALWLLAVRLDGSPTVPAPVPGRPDGLAALAEVLVTVGGWLVPTAIGLVLLAGVAAWERWREPAGAGAGVGGGVGRAPTVLLASSLAGCLLCLAVMRARGALPPLDGSSVRGLAPLWPLAALWLSIVVHRTLWRRRGRAVRWAGGLLVLALLAVHGAALWQPRPAATPLDEPTLRRAVEQIGDDNGVILSNRGAALSVALPRARVLGLAPWQAGLDERQLGAVIDRFGVEWLLLFRPSSGAAADGRDDWYELPDGAAPAARSGRLIHRWSTRGGTLYSVE